MKHEWWHHVFTSECTDREIIEWLDAALLWHLILNKEES